MYLICYNIWIFFQRGRSNSIYFIYFSGSFSKTGLGSSAALTVSLIASIFQVFGLVTRENQSSEESLQILHNMSQLVHCIAQGKVGSGFDISAAIFGSQKYFRFSPEVAFESWPLHFLFSFKSTLIFFFFSIGEEDFGRCCYFVNPFNTDTYYIKSVNMGFSASSFLYVKILINKENMKIFFSFFSLFFWGGRRIAYLQITIYCFLVSAAIFVTSWCFFSVGWYSGRIRNTFYGQKSVGMEKWIWIGQWRTWTLEQHCSNQFTCCSTIRCNVLIVIKAITLILIDLVVNCTRDTECFFFVENYTAGGYDRRAGGSLSFSLFYFLTLPPSFK